MSAIAARIVAPLEFLRRSDEEFVAAWQRASAKPIGICLATPACRSQEPGDQLMQAIKVDRFGQITGNTGVIGRALETLGAKGSDGYDRYGPQRTVLAHPARGA